MKPDQSCLILGGGITGLAAGVCSGFPVYEAAEVPGGICASYYVRPGVTQRCYGPPPDGEAYRFEIGGGHWIFGGSPVVLHWIEQAAPTKAYRRVSGVWFPDERLHVPYPLQYHLRHLGPDLAAQALREMIAVSTAACTTMEQWLYASFGRTLCDKFFAPFHDLYTAGLYRAIAPQDSQKMPVELARVIDGSLRDTTSDGYNATFRYPSDGLDCLVQRMAERCDLHCGKEVSRIDVDKRQVHFADGTREEYQRLLCTLPLNKTLDMCGLDAGKPADPHSSVLVLNVGGVKGPSCPADHWLYHPASRSGFHRVGFYSNVAPSFLPRSSRPTQDRVSMYVERAFRAGARPTAEQTSRYAESAIGELRQWGFLESAEVVDSTWIDVAYTWRFPQSQWQTRATRLLEEKGVFPVGRYARWKFQGIADSIAEGLCAGAALACLS